MRFYFHAVARLKVRGIDGVRRSNFDAIWFKNNDGESNSLILGNDRVEVHLIAASEWACSWKRPHLKIVGKPKQFINVIAWRSDCVPHWNWLVRLQSRNKESSQNLSPQRSGHKNYWHHLWRKWPNQFEREILRKYFFNQDFSLVRSIAIWTWLELQKSNLLRKRLYGALDNNNFTFSHPHQLLVALWRPRSS